jgi:uncharacterized protein (TIGR02217 family)
MAAPPFLEVRLSDRVARGMERSKTNPGRTLSRSATGGIGGQNFTSAYPIHLYDVVPGIERRQDFQAVEDLWYAVNFGSGGPYSGFRLRDYHDDKLTAANSRLVLISGSDYQIHRVHAVAGAEFLRPIYKPNAGVSVLRNRSGSVTVAAATVDTETGQVAISGHVDGDTYSAVGTFDMPVTFSSNEWSASVIGAVGNIVSVSGAIQLEEIRVGIEP